MQESRPAPVAQPAAGPAEPPGGRNETELERADRNLVELLQEVRVVQTGVQVLFAFLLSAVFQQRFHILSTFDRIVYFGTLLAAGAAVLMLTAPSSHHRILFRCGDKPHLVTVANRLTILGLSLMGLSMIGVLMLVSNLLFSTPVTVAVTVGASLGCAIFWYALPLARRRTLKRAEQAAASAQPPRDGRQQRPTRRGTTSPPAAA